MARLDGNPHNRRVYGTEDLIVSFDVVNVQWPNRKDAPPNKRWAHQDQDPERPGFRCLQGLVNLNENGPDDGGLVLMRGAHKISEEYHNTFRDEERIWQWTNEWYGYKDTGLEWLKERGYEVSLSPFHANAFSEPRDEKVRTRDRGPRRSYRMG